MSPRSSHAAAWVLIAFTSAAAVEAATGERAPLASGVTVHEPGRLHEQSLDANVCDACRTDATVVCRPCRTPTGGHCLEWLGPCDWLGRHRAGYSKAQRRGLADKHSPASIMGDHVHHQGEVMVEYRYMNMYMDGNKIGTRNVADADAFGFDGTNLAATPTEMTMEMHMLHVMYGLTDNVTLYVMPMWKVNTMDHLRNTPFPPNAGLSGTPFTTSNSGFADLAMGGLWRIYEGDDDEIILNLSFSVPTGDIDNTTTIPTGGAVAQEFPYPMRLGSGTFNARPGFTYKCYQDIGSFGLQYQTDLPIGDNDQDYSVGDEHRLSVWYSYLPCDRLALSYRVEGLWRTNYDGADPDLTPGIISTNRPDMRGGEWLNFGYGVMWLVGNGHLLNFEAVHPVHQRLSGIQLSEDWRFTVSWSKAW